MRLSRERAILEPRQDLETKILEGGIIMRKWLLVPMIGALLGVVLLGGCTSGVSQEDFARLEAQVAKLSAISAYSI